MTLLEMSFKKIAAHIDTVIFKEFDSPPDKFGLRSTGNRVIFTYNSYRKGWLDTNPVLGSKLSNIFKFLPSHNKPMYWVVQVPNGEAAVKFEKHFNLIVKNINAFIKTLN
jgi:hypothetical protein